jgi:hypothetical protein
METGRSLRSPLFSLLSAGFGTTSSITPAHLSRKIGCPTLPAPLWEEEVEKGEREKDPFLIKVVETKERQVRSRQVRYRPCDSFTIITETKAEYIQTF